MISNNRAQRPLQPKLSVAYWKRRIAEAEEDCQRARAVGRRADAVALGNYIVWMCGKIKAMESAETAEA